MAKKKGTRREKREQRKAEREAQEAAAQEAAAKRKRTLSIIALVTVIASLAVGASDGPKALIGIILLAGVGSFLAVGLGGLGGSVKPKDRGKSGNIDYGR